MQRSAVRNERQALEYLVDCTLATVSHMAMLKSRKKGEYERHIEIAQVGVDWLKRFNLDIEVGSRAYEVLSTKTQTVKEWTKEFEV